MLKTACFLTGDNYNLVAADTPASKKKVVAMALAMMVPVLIWVFNDFMLSHQVLQTGLGWAIVTALVCGMIVFFIEKLIVMANGNRWLTFFRISIGLIVALLGSIAIDEVVFRNDIDISVGAIREKSIARSKDDAANDFMELHRYGNLNKAIEDAQAKYDNSVSAVIAEADGSYGTKKRGIGMITQLKERKSQDRKIELDQLLAQKVVLDRAKDSAVNAAGLITGTSFNEHALLTRIKALFRLVVKDGYMLTNYILFTLLLFFFEFLVVILKLTWKKTNYERKVEMIEEIGQRRMEFLKRPDSLLLDPGFYLPQFENTRSMANQAPSLFQ